MALRVVDTGTRPPEGVPDDIEVVHRPMLEVRPVEVDPERLRRAFARPAAVVVYSRNAVRMLEQTGLLEALGPLDRHQWWAVGEKTHQALAYRLGVRARVPADNHFEGLYDAFADLPAEVLPDRVVSLSLEGKFRDLSPVLAPREVIFEDIPVYETAAMSYANLRDELRETAPDWLVITSSRGGDILLDHLQDPPRRPDELLEGIGVATIGPKTAAHLKARGLTVDLVPDAPDKALLYRDLAAASLDQPP